MKKVFGDHYIWYADKQFTHLIKISTIEVYCAAKMALQKAAIKPFRPSATKNMSCMNHSKPQNPIECQPIVAPFASIVRRHANFSSQNFFFYKNYYFYKYGHREKDGL